MRTFEERLEILHNKAQILKKRREVAIMRALGGATGVLSMILVALVSLLGKGGHDISGSGYAGTSLLSESAGGYVLVAVIAFALGVFITVFLIRNKRKE